MPTVRSIARLKIDLDEVKPPVMRRIEVPVDVLLVTLHEIIQVAMGWENYHLFEFRVGKTCWSIPDPDWQEWGSGGLSAEQATLDDLLRMAGTTQFKYTYDFGDDWDHTIKVEALSDADPDATYPRLLAARGACPPEDCGGPWGYQNYLEAIADPDHEQHHELLEWRGPGFDAKFVDEARIQRTLATFARRTAKRRSARRKRA
jgi:hypothetical protein